MRAKNSGTFKLSVCKVEEMYNPEVFGILYLKQKYNSEVAMKRSYIKHVAYYCTIALKAGAIVCVVAIVTYIVFPYSEGYLATNYEAPITIYDRHGTVLMQIIGGKRGVSQSVNIKEVPSEFKDNNALYAAMVIIDNKTMEVITMLGSIDFFDYGKGQIDATLIKKQTASTMKPFAYALALDNGIFHTSSILPDMYMQFYSKVGNYIPKNFSKSYHGPVRLAKALGCSCNITAVYVTSKVGVVAFYNFLRSIGFDSINRSPSFCGLGIVVGNAEVTLLELANAYTIFPRWVYIAKPMPYKRLRMTQGKRSMWYHLRKGQLP
ncbi:MAG: penicillin-binding transpeptidase domain-containing protein [Spirochaetota bacterium]